MRKSALLVVNPVSGGIDKTGFIDATLLFGANENLDVLLFQTTGVDDVSKIKSLYDQFNPERIIVIGGDGTIKLVAETLENHDAILGIIPAGSANGLATDLKLPSLPERCLEVAFGNNIIEIDILTINNEICLHLSDLGLNADLIKRYEESAIHGKLGYIFQILNTLIDSDSPFKVQITANDKTIECEARMIVIANAQKYGTGVIINPIGLMDDGMFELIILKNLDLVVFTKIITGNIPVNSEDVDIISTSVARIITDIPISFQIDGEYYGQVTDLDIKILPRKIKIAIP